MAFEIIHDFNAGRASYHQVMRVLVSHDGWYAPAELATRHSATSFDQLWIGGPTGSSIPNQLWLFSSAEEVHRAQDRFSARTGRGLGSYVGPVAGIDLFASLSQQLSAIVVDIASLPDSSWVMEGRAIEIARRWGLALALERALDDCPHDLYLQMIGYEDYLVLAMPEGELATAARAGGLIQPVMAFTAIDAAELAVAAMGSRGPDHIARITGRNLFPLVVETSAGGVVVNSAGPGLHRYPFTPGLCRSIAELAIAVDHDTDEDLMSSA